MSCWDTEHDAECQRKTAAGEPTLHWICCFDFGMSWFDSEAANRVIRLTPVEEPDEYDAWAAFGGFGGPPAGKPCPRCQTPVIWHERLCAACKELMVLCPATHEANAPSCVLCRETPGYVEELK